MVRLWEHAVAEQDRYPARLLVTLFGVERHLPCGSKQLDLVLQCVGNRDRRAFFPEVMIGTPGEAIMRDEEITDSLVFVGGHAVIFVDRHRVETTTREIVDQSHRRRLDQLDAR